METEHNQMPMSTDNQQESLISSPEEAKAALGLSTRLTEQFLMSQSEGMGEGMGVNNATEEDQSQTPSQSLKSQPGREEIASIHKELSDMEQRLMEEIRGIKSGDVNSEIEDIKRELETLSKEDNGQETEN